MINRFYSVFYSCLLTLGITFLCLSQQVLAKKGFSIEETFKTHCIECHGAKEKVKGDKMINEIEESFNEIKEVEERKEEEIDLWEAEE